MSATLISTIMRMMYGSAGKDRLRAMLGAFFDDSGTHSASPVVSIGGLLGTEDQWDAFAFAWDELLAKPLAGKPRLRQFHLSPCRAGTGEFENYSLAERDRITYLFRQVILDTGLITIAAVVDRAAWNALVIGDIATRLGDPVELCFVKCIELTMNAARSRKPGENVHFICDQGTVRLLGIWSRIFQSQTDTYPDIAGFSFARAADVVGLQGADMIATESYQFAQQWLNDRTGQTANPHFEDFLKRELSVGIVIGEEQIAQMVKRVKNTISQESDYA